MSDVLIYWRDYKQNWARQFAGDRGWYWHSNARMVGGLQAGDRLWIVTSGKNLRHEVGQAGFLVAVWQVRQVIDNPGEDPAYPREEYGSRLIGDPSASIVFDEPVLVDHIVRPHGRDTAVSIGRYLQGPRRLNADKVKMLRSAAGPQMARHYLTTKQA
jgi:hypothetical protein